MSRIVSDSVVDPNPKESDSFGLDPNPKKSSDSDTETVEIWKFIWKIEDQTLEKFFFSGVQVPEHIWKLLQSHWNCRIRFHCLIETTEAKCFRHSFMLQITFLRKKLWCWSFYKDSMVSLKPRKPLSQSHWNRPSRFHVLIETAESASAVSLKPRKSLPRSHWDRGSRLFQPFSRQIQSHMRNGFLMNQGPPP
jgi:hypothetical protein